MNNIYDQANLKLAIIENLKCLYSDMSYKYSVSVEEFSVLLEEVHKELCEKSNVIETVLKE